MPTFCTFCDGEAYLPHCVKPAMCEKHLELILMMSRLARNERPVTQANVRAEISSRFTPMALQAEEVPELMIDFKGRW